MQYYRIRQLDLKYEQTMGSRCGAAPLQGLQSVALQHAVSTKIARHVEYSVSNVSNDAHTLQEEFFFLLYLGTSSTAGVHVVTDSVVWELLHFTVNHPHYSNLLKLWIIPSLLK